MNIFQKILWLFKSVTTAFFKKTLKEIKDNEKYIHDASTLLYNIYNYVEHPDQLGQAVEAVLPADWTTEIKTLAVENLLPIAKTFKQLEGAVNNIHTTDDLIKAIGEGIRSLDKESFTFVAHNFSSLLAVKLSKGALLLKNVYTVIESVWQAFTKPEIQEAAQG